MKQKWVDLSAALKAARVYHEDRIAPQTLQKRFHSGHAAMRETSEVFGSRTIKAFGALWPTWRPDCWEVGTLFVRPEYRGNGLLPEIMDELMRRAPNGSSLFFITKEERIMKLAPEYGFVRVSGTTYPNILRWASQRGLVCRLPKSVYKVGWPSPEPRERWLFMREGR